MVSAMNNFSTTSLEELMITTVRNEACLIRRANRQNSQDMNSLQRDVIFMRNNDEELFYIREHLLQNSRTRMMFQDEETMINRVTNEGHLMRQRLLQASQARNILQEDIVVRTITTEANTIRQWLRTNQGQQCSSSLQERSRLSSNPC